MESWVSGSALVSLFELPTIRPGLCSSLPGMPFLDNYRLAEQAIVQNRRILCYMLRRL